MLVGQGEELAHGLGADLAQGREQPGHHAAEQLVGLQVQGRLRQPRVAPQEQRGAQQAQAADRPFQQVPDERFCGRVPLQCVQAALDDGGSRFFVHGEASPRNKGLQTFYPNWCPSAPLRNTGEAMTDSPRGREGTGRVTNQGFA